MWKQCLYLITLFVIATEIATAFLHQPNNGLGSSLRHAGTKPNINLHVKLSSSTTTTQSLEEEEEETNNNDDGESIDIVLFGVGDLRTDDHLGLFHAMENSISMNSKILPLIILDEQTLANIPGSVAHTIDTATMLIEAIDGLKKSLKEKGLSLHVSFGGNSLSKELTDIVDGLNPSSSSSSSVQNIRLHVCDLGPADNNMQYTALSNLNNLPSNIFTVQPWTCNLWENASANIENLPDTYPDFVNKYKTDPIKPISSSSSSSSSPVTNFSSVACQVPNLQQIISSTELYELIQKSLPDNKEQQIESKRTGLYGTHWGGLNHQTVTESSVRDALRIYTEECYSDDISFDKYSFLNCKRNQLSLEHAVMEWNLRGDDDVTQMNNNNYDNNFSSKNLIPGERLTRFLLAPMFLGTISPRRVWYSVKSSIFAESPIRKFIEAHEWHRLLTARNIATRLEYQNKGLKGSVETDSSSSSSSFNYKYFRWNGFLCRYGESSIITKNEDDDDQDAADTEGLLFVHGFGASGSQWTKLANSLSESFHNDMTNKDGDDVKSNIECLAPDLIGFGESEKPPITYSGYLWESFVNDFIKEIASTKNRWQRFVIGGNSIGGFVGMCSAANDASTGVPTNDKNNENIQPIISGSGARGTGKCNGVILMNPAGVIQSKEMVDSVLEAASGNTEILKSVAQVTAMDILPPCKPLPLPVAKLFGNLLLFYLRPQIRSICQKIYPVNPNAVDDILCSNILRDSLDPGAVNVMISGSKLPLPRIYNEVIGADFGQSCDTNDASSTTTSSTTASTYNESTFEGPILMSQGILDPLNDAKGRAETFQTLRQGIKVDQLEGGHCPHDEVPDKVAASIVAWLKETQIERTNLFLGRQQEVPVAES